jgi:hypothetical protein
MTAQSFVVIKSKHLKAQTVQRLLAAELESAPDVHLELKLFRSAETAVLVAIVGSIGTGLGALITGILKVAADRHTGKIVLQGRSGRKVEFPADIPINQVNAYIQLAKELDVEQIEL